VAEGIRVLRAVDARYLGQGYELSVAVPPGPVDTAMLTRVRAAFDEAYAARYGYANPSEPVQVVNWTLTAVGASPRLLLPKATGRLDGQSLKARRRAYFPEAGGFLECAVYDRYALAPGEELTGPAIIEERESTTVLPPGVRAMVDEYANLIAAVTGT